MNTLSLILKIIWLWLSAKVEYRADKKDKKEKTLDEVHEAFKEPDRRKRASKLNAILQRMR